MGLGAQMVLWDDAFCEALAAQGYRVIRFDNRDIGRSAKLTGGGRLSALEFLALRLFGRKVKAPYLLSDMAADTIGLLDALGIQTAHLVGASMGGMIAQECAIRHPARVRSLTSIMSTTSEPGLPGPTKEALAVLMQSPPRTKEEYFISFKRTWRVLRAGSFPEDEAMDEVRAERCFSRGLNPAGVGRQFRAIIASGSRKQALASVKAPTLVIHGRIDPLVKVECGMATAKAVPGAKLVLLDDMGHAIARHTWSPIIEAIAGHAR